MHRGPSHIPLEPALESTPSRPVHDGRIIPAHHIPVLPPLDAEQVLILRRVREQALDQLRALRFLDPAPVGILQVVQVVRDVQVHSAARLVALDDPVAAERVCFRVDRGEKLGLRAGLAPAVPETVRSDVVVLEELTFQVRGQFVKSCAGVGEVGVTPVAWWWELVRAKQRVAGAAGVEGRVAMEEGVSLRKCGLSTEQKPSCEPKPD